MTWESYVFDLLTASLARPLWLAAAAWLVVRLLRIRHPASRHGLWAAVLMGMLLLPEASMIAPRWTLPLIPRSQYSNDRAGRTVGSVSVDFEAPASVVQAANRNSQLTQNVAASSLPTIETSIVWCYLAGVFAMALYRLMGWTLLRRVVSRSRRVRGRRVLESVDLATPVAAGVLRPAVILPAGWREWDAATKRAVLAHEFAHLRRRDTLVAALTRFAQCVFWFHPLTWWLAHQLHDLAELACDAAALERHDDPAGYSRILLNFADAVNRSGQRAAWPGLAMASSSNMGRRIDELFELSGGTMRKLSRPVLLLALIGPPVLCLAATVGLREQAPQPTVKTVIGGVQFAELIHPIAPPDSAALADKPRVRPQTVAQQAAPPSIAPGQTPLGKAASAVPTFEVAAIKPCKGDEGGGRGGRGGGGAGSLGLNPKTETAS
jgi:beta-lactamase regulating signal transducer with metallopeptidase domain